MASAIVRATLIAGSLDLLSAFVFAGMAGMGPVDVLHFVASGPFGDQAKSGAVWAVAGLAVHYIIMACMAAAFMSTARHLSALTRHPIASGLAYGFALWIIMYWIVRPLRWPAFWPPSSWAMMTEREIAWSVGNALFSHCILVGIPIALVAAKSFRQNFGQETS
jgi:hypothetical protein